MAVDSRPFPSGASDVHGVPPAFLGGRGGGSSGRGAGGQGLRLCSSTGPCPGRRRVKWGLHRGRIKLGVGSRWGDCGWRGRILDYDDIANPASRVIQLLDLAVADSVLVGPLSLARCDGGSGVHCGGRRDWQAVERRVREDLRRHMMHRGLHCGCCCERRCGGGGCGTREGEGDDRGNDGRTTGDLKETQRQDRETLPTEPYLFGGNPRHFTGIRLQPLSAFFAVVNYRYYDSSKDSKARKVTTITTTPLLTHLQSVTPNTPGSPPAVPISRTWTIQAIPHSICTSTRACGARSWVRQPAQQRNSCAQSSEHLSGLGVRAVRPGWDRVSLGACCSFSCRWPAEVALCLAYIVCTLLPQLSRSKSAVFEPSFPYQKYSIIPMSCPMSVCFRGLPRARRTVHKPTSSSPCGPGPCVCRLLKW